MAKLFRSDDFPTKDFAPKCNTHDFQALVAYAGLTNIFNLDTAADATLWTHWQVVAGWKESHRYERVADVKAREMYNALTCPTGVMQWIRRHW